MPKKKKRRLKKEVKVILMAAAVTSLSLMSVDVYATYNPYKSISDPTDKQKTVTYDVYTKTFLSNGETVKNATLSTNSGTVCTNVKGNVIAETNKDGQLEYVEQGGNNIPDVGQQSSAIDDAGKSETVDSLSGIVNGWLNGIYYIDGKPLGTDEDSLLFVAGETGFYYLTADQGGKRLINSAITLNDGREVRFDEYGHIVTKTIHTDNEYYFPVSEAEETASETYTVPINEYAHTESTDADTDLTVVNHRGYHEDTTENTLAAFAESKRNNYAYIETDVQMTADDIPVLIHDQSLYRLAGKSVNINDLTLDEAKKYSLGGEEITEFEELISYCKANELSPYIELKAETVTTKEQVQTIYNMVDKYGMVDNVTWISFAPKLLGYVSEIDTEDRIGYLVSSYADSVIEFCEDLQGNGIDAFVNASYYCYESYISKCKKNDIPLEVWTVNSDALISSLDGYVSGVTTDICLPE